MNYANGFARLSSFSSALSSPEPISLVEFDNNPFYAVNRFQPSVFEDLNPSSDYQFTRKFIISAVATSNLAKLRDLIWFPRVKFEGTANADANLIGESEGRLIIFAAATSISQLVGNSNGEITKVAGNADSEAILSTQSEGLIITFGDANGIADLESISISSVNVFGQAIGNATLLGESEGVSDVFGFASGIATLTSYAGAGVIVGAAAAFDGPLDGNANASVTTFATAIGNAAFSGFSNGIGTIFEEADSSAVLVSSASGFISVNAVAFSSAILSSFANGDFSLLPGVASGIADLTGNAIGDFSLLPAETNSFSNLIGVSAGNLSLIPAEASGSAQLSPFANGEAVVPSVFDSYDWEEAFDSSQITLLGTGVGGGLTNNMNPNGAEVPNVGNPSFSASAVTAGFTGRGSTGATNINWNSVVNSSTSGLNPSGIGPSRVNGAVDIANATNLLNSFDFDDLDPAGSRITVLRAPIHYRCIAQINQGEAFLFFQHFVINSFSGPRFGSFVEYQTSGNIRGRYSAVYNFNGNALITGQNSIFPFSITGSQWVLIDLIIRQNGAFPQFDLMVNGTQNVFNTTDSRYSWSGGSFSIYGRILDNQSTGTAKGLFYAYRTGIDLTLAEHNADVAAIIL